MQSQCYNFPHTLAQRMQALAKHSQSKLIFSDRIGQKFAVKRAMWSKSLQNNSSQSDQFERPERSQVLIAQSCSCKSLRALCLPRSLEDADPDKNLQLCKSATLSLVRHSRMRRDNAKVPSGRS